MLKLNVECAFLQMYVKTICTLSQMTWHHVRNKRYVHWSDIEFIYLLFLVTLLILLPDKTSLKFQYCKIATVRSHYIIIQWGCNIPLENQSGENVEDNRQGSPLARGDSGSGKKSDLEFNKYFRRALYWQIVFTGNSNNRLCIKCGWLVYNSVWL